MQKLPREKSSAGHSSNVYTYISIYIVVCMVAVKSYNTNTFLFLWIRIVIVFYCCNDIQIRKYHAKIIMLIKMHRRFTVAVFVFLLLLSTFQAFNTTMIHFFFSFHVSHIRVLDITFVYWIDQYQHDICNTYQFKRLMYDLMLILGHHKR